MIEVGHWLFGLGQHCRVMHFIALGCSWITVRQLKACKGRGIIAMLVRGLKTARKG